LSRSRELLKSLVGPHVLFAGGAGVVQAALLLKGHNAPFWAAFGLVAAAAAVFAKRLTGNTLVSACAGGIVALHPEGIWELFAPMMADRDVPGWTPSIMRALLGNLVSAACGLVAAGVRLLPSAELDGAPLFGKREWLAIVLLVAGALLGPAVLVMPLLILLADLAFSPARTGVVLRRTGALLPLHAAAVAPAWLLAESLPPGLDLGQFTSSEWQRVQERLVHVFDPLATIEGARFFVADTGPLIAALTLGSLIVLALRARIRQRLIVTTAFAVVWAAAVFLLPLVLPSGRIIPGTMLVVFGPALLFAAVLWRIAVAMTHPLPAPVDEEPQIPSVPAIRDLIRQMRAEARPAGAVPAAPRVESAAGMRSTVESAVAGAVAATLEQIRLAFRGPHPTEPPGTPEQVLWNRLLTQGSGGAAPDEKPGAAIARWRDFHAKNVKTRIKAGADVLCVGVTPWPLVAAMAESARTVALVERGPRAAQIAASDLAAVKNVMVVRHDGRALKAIGDGMADAVIALVEPTLELAGDVLALLRESRRVLRRGGVAAIGFADLALPAAQEALGRSSQSACFTNKEAVETLARLAGLGPVEVAPGAVGATSIAWITS
jgi:hypothetical protein